MHHFRPAATRPVATRPVNSTSAPGSDRAARQAPAPLSPERWVVQIFSARAAAQGGVVRRRIADVDRIVGRERFLAEVRRRGFRVARNADQFVIFCNRDPVILMD